MQEVYKNTGDMEAFFETASFEELKALAAKYKNGVTVATPVFSGVQRRPHSYGAQACGL